MKYICLKYFPNEVLEVVEGKFNYFTKTNGIAEEVPSNMYDTVHLTREAAERESGIRRDMAVEQDKWLDEGCKKKQKPIPYERFTDIEEKYRIKVFVDGLSVRWCDR